MMEVSREYRGVTYLTVDEVAAHGEEPVEIVLNSTEQVT